MAKHLYRIHVNGKACISFQEALLELKRWLGYQVPAFMLSRALMLKCKHIDGVSVEYKPVPEVVNEKRRALMRLPERGLPQRWC